MLCVSVNPLRIPMAGTEAEVVAMRPGSDSGSPDIEQYSGLARLQNVLNMPTARDVFYKKNYAVRVPTAKIVQVNGRCQQR